MKLIALLILLCVAGCASSRTPDKTTSASPEPTASEPEGKWENIHRSDPNLAGVVVQQFPDGDDGYTGEQRAGQHPAMIIFGFWDDRFQQRHYTPKGEVTDEFWFKIDANSKRIWDNVDFNQGSDPMFRLHPDPRKRWKNASLVPSN